jgi:hypothetical protein
MPELQHYRTGILPLAKVQTVKRRRLKPVNNYGLYRHDQLPQRKEDPCLLPANSLTSKTSLMYGRRQKEIKRTLMPLESKLLGEVLLAYQLMLRSRHTEVKYKSHWCRYLKMENRCLLFTKG